MKKNLLIAVCFMAAAVINAQSLEEIVKKFTVANKTNQIASKKTLKITANMSAMGMDISMQLLMKNPNKIKTVTNVNGMEIIQSFDGEKGYSVNPMAGSADPVEMGPDEVRQLTRSNVFQNSMDEYLKNGMLALEGEEEVNGKPAFKIKAAVEGVKSMRFFIDKDSYLLVKTNIEASQQGMDISVDSYPSDYKETNGVLLPMKTTTSAMGMEYVMTYTNVEVDVPIEDSVFKLK